MTVGFDQHNLGVLERLQLDLGQVDHGHAVARVGGDRRAAGRADLDPAARRYQVGRLAVELLADRLARLQRAGIERAVGVERDRAVMAAAGGQRHQPPVARLGRELHRLPARRNAFLVRQDPDLEQLGLVLLEVVLGMLDAAPGAHHLDLAGLGATLVAEMVLVGDRAADHVGHDLHVAMGMRREPGLRLDAVVVPDAQRAPVDALGVAVLGEAEMEVGVQPAVVGLAEFREGPELDHDVSPLRAKMAKGLGRSSFGLVTALAAPPLPRCTAAVSPARRRSCRRGGPSGPRPGDAPRGPRRAAAPGRSCRAAARPRPGRSSARRRAPSRPAWRR